MYEQLWSVAKVEQRMGLVDALETQLAASRATAANLLSPSSPNSPTPPKMKAPPHQLAATFKDAFCKALESNERTDLLKMWQSVADKTWFYEKTLMPAVAQQLAWELHIEKFRCDFMFLDERDVPLIAVESENKHPTAGHEVNCLCSLAAPLKVLLLSCDWQATEKAKYLPNWAEIIRTHHSVVSVDCLYLIVVGEWDEPDDALLEYSFTLVDTHGIVLEESKHSVPA